MRKYISLLLLAVYLFAAGGAAVASLSCHCLAEKAHLAEHAQACCHQHDHEGDLLAATADISAPCCGDRHSTEIELYTGSTSENDRPLRCAIISLPPAMAVECPCPEHTPVLREKTVERRAPFIREACILPSGFRAPPVLA